jgi:chitosanase
MEKRRELEKIRNVLVVAETGKQVIPYGAVYVMADGPNNIKQITLSIGFTQYGGNLSKVIEEYGRKNGEYSLELTPMLAVMRKMDTVSNSHYLKSLKEAGADPIMKETQDAMFDSLYLEPAIKWAEAEGFVEPLSMLIIADSFLHSGSMLLSLRSKFSEKTPKWGGLERAWIIGYLNARHKWLANHSSRLLRNTTYRTTYYKKLIVDGDWSLDTYHTLAMNGTKPLAVA